MERCPRQAFLPIGRDGRRRTLPVPCPPIAKRAGGMPVDISGTLSRLVNTDNEEARKVAPEFYDCTLFIRKKVDLMFRRIELRDMDLQYDLFDEKKL